MDGRRREGRKEKEWGRKERGQRGGEGRAGNRERGGPSPEFPGALVCAIQKTLSNHHWNESHP